MKFLKGVEGGGGEFGVETERYMTFFREQIKLRVAPKHAQFLHPEKRDLPDTIGAVSNLALTKFASAW